MKIKNIVLNYITNIKYKIIDYIGRKTEKIRYNLVALSVKRLTPALYKKIDMDHLIIRKSLQLKDDSIPNIIRPSFSFMKERFDGILVKGAEIGVERGKNAEIILKELNIEKLYLIDVWDDYDEIDQVWSNTSYRKVLEKFRKNEKVEIIKEQSKHAVNNIEDNSLDFVYIDANHKYEYVCQDISLWFPKVKIGGIMAGHDIMLNYSGNFFDVLEAVKNFCYKHNIYFYIKSPDWYFIK